MNSENSPGIFSTESEILPNTPSNSVFPHHNKNRFSDDPNATVGILKKFTETFQKYSGESIGRLEVECNHGGLQTG